jgi:hypothetical protein
MTLNPYKEYSIKTATTFTGTEATSAGYGIYIQTQINTNGNLDGYIFQYDKGLGKLVIKQLVDSSETGKNIYLDTSVIDDFYPDNDVWWTTKHSIQIDVTDSTTDSTKQNLKISIDNNVISDSYSSNYGGTAIANDHLTIDKPVETNYTGFRTWNVTNKDDVRVNTTVKVDSVSITEL